MIDHKDITIIIPHLGDTKEQRFSLNECLKSLDETVPDIKKIVSMNGIGETDESLLDPLPQNTTPVFMESQGQCKAVNAAVATTNTPWIFVTNDDMIYPKDWWRNLMYGVHYDLGCVSPKLVEPRPGAPTFEVFFAGGAGGDFNKEKWEGFAEEHNERNYSYRTGFNLPFLIRRDIWDTIGGYDINYDPWGSNSDSDLEYKIRLAGIQPKQNPNCVVYHFGQTSGTFHPDNRSYWDNNWRYFIEKWGFERASSPSIWEANFNIPSKEEGRKFNPKWENKYKI